MAKKKTFKINLNVYVICKLIHDGVCAGVWCGQRRKSESNRARNPEDSKVNNTL